MIAHYHIQLLNAGLAVVAFALPNLAGGAVRKFALPAADQDRAAQVVVVRESTGDQRATVARDAQGRVFPLQIDTTTARIVVPWQKAGETLVLTLEAKDLASGRGVEVQSHEGDLSVRVDGQPAFVYRMDREKLPRPNINPALKRAGYIHPVFSPSGKIVTDDYPSNHAWHHGIWTPWVKTSFQGRTPDFWNMEKKTGAEDFVALERTWNGPVHGGFLARQRMIDFSTAAPVEVLHETWEVTAYDFAAEKRPAHVFDLVVTQTCATDSPLILPKYHYGGFGFRGAAEWNGPGDSARFLTSEGVSDRLKGNATRSHWCYVGGFLGGAPSGVLILGHASNFRAPQPVRLHPNFPYMSFVPQQLGEFSIQPGAPYVARFRFVVVDGEPDRALFEAYWQGYVNSATPEMGAN